MELYLHILGRVPKKNRKDSLARLLNVFKNSKHKQTPRESQSCQMQSENRLLSPDRVIEAKKREENEEMLKSVEVDYNTTIQTEKTSPSAHTSESISYGIKDILELINVPNLSGFVYQNFSEKYPRVQDSDVERVKIEILKCISDTLKSTREFDLKIEPPYDNGPFLIRGTFELSQKSVLYISDNDISKKKPHEKHWIKLSFENEQGLRKIVVKEGPLQKRCMISFNKNPQPLYNHSEFLVGKKLFKFEITMFTIIIISEHTTYEFKLNDARRGIITIGRSPDNSIAINNMSISRFHAEIFYKYNGWFIKSVSKKDIKLFVHAKQSIKKRKSSFKYKIDSNQKIIIDDIPYKLILKNKYTSCDPIEDND